jgi:hypothetical protein
MPTATEVREPQIENSAVVWEPVRIPLRQAIQQISHLPVQPPLFADSLLDPGQQERNRRRFAAVVSFTFQSLLIGLLLIVPLMFTEALPKQQLLILVAKIVRQIRSDLLTTGQLRTPTRIPEKVQMIREEEAPPPLASMGGVEECQEVTRVDNSEESWAGL